jgi:molybdenum cofactor cytidylyltransferase
MGTPKALLDWDGESLAGSMIARYSAICTPLVLVVGFHADEIEGALRHTAPVIMARNPDPARGQLSSLQCGLGAIGRPFEAVMISPIDYAAVRGETIRQIASAFLHSPDTAAVIPTHHGRRGHPILITAGVAQEIAALPPDSDPRPVLRAHYPETMFLETTDEAVLHDMDTPEQYRSLRKHWRGQG